MKTTVRIQNKTATSSTGSQVQFSLTEFESAKAQSHALHLLLADVMGTMGHGTYGEEIQFGISELISQTQDRMDRVYDAVQKQIGVTL